MAQDIRDLFKKEAGLKKANPPKGHQERFEARLNTMAPTSQRLFYGYKIAAILVIVLGIGWILNNLSEGKTLFNHPEIVNSSQEQKETLKAASPVYLSDLSPEYRKIENYYLAMINTELAQLKMNDENKALIDSFLAQLAELDVEYQRLNKELQEVGVTENSVAVLIENLKLRLNLLVKLKSKLNNLQKSTLNKTTVKRL